MKRLSILIFSSDIHPFYETKVRLLENRGHQVELYTFRGYKNPFIYLMETSKLRQRNLKKFDLIHAYFGPSGFIAIMQGKTPVITTYIGSDLLGEINSNGKYDIIQTIMVRILSGFAGLFSFKTTTISSKLEERVFCKKKNEVIRLGVDINHFQQMDMLNARIDLNWDHEGIYILFPADRKRVVKRFHVAEQIIDILKKNYSNIHLVSIDRPNMYPMIPKIMNASNAMLLVSHHEGSPSVIREAMACNLPIFAFDVGDVQEQTLGINPGFVANQDDINALIQAIDEFLNESQLNRSNGRNKMISRTWENYIDEIENLYYEIVQLKS